MAANFERLQMKNISKAIVLVATSLIALPTWAVNKCTSSDGKIVFQDAPCQSSTKSETLKIGAKAGGESWQFARNKDDMTGLITCFAVSPSVYALRLKGSPIAKIQIAMRNDIVSLSIQSPISTSAFHNDISGMGIKIDGNDFVEINRKSSSTAVGFQPDSQALLIDQMKLGQSIKMRLKFWPWDELGDTEYLSLTGFKQALALAQECSKKT
jgi:hypothetical protein